MLNAVLKGKTQGILRQDYTGEFAGYEDSLTATVFERLFYLSQLRIRLGIKYPFSYSLNVSIWSVDEAESYNSSPHGTPLVRSAGPSSRHH